MEIVRYRFEIVRYSSAIIGSFLIICGVLWLSSELMMGSLLIYTGLLFLYASWFHQVNLTVKRIIDSLVQIIRQIFQNTHMIISSLFLRIRK